jgi:hypothetical protein
LENIKERKTSEVRSQLNQKSISIPSMPDFSFSKRGKEIDVLQGSVKKVERMGCLREKDQK